MKKEFDPQEHPWIVLYSTILLGFLFGISVFLIFCGLLLLMEVNPIAFIVLIVLIGGTVVCRFLIF